MLLCGLGYSDCLIISFCVVAFMTRWLADCHKMFFFWKLYGWPSPPPSGPSHPEFFYCFFCFLSSENNWEVTILRRTFCVGTYFQDQLKIKEKSASLRRQPLLFPHTFPATSHQLFWSRLLLASAHKNMSSIIKKGMRASSSSRVLFHIVFLQFSSLICFVVLN